MSLHEEYFEPLAGDHDSLMPIGLYSFQSCKLSLPLSVDVVVLRLPPFREEIGVLLDVA